MKCLRLVQSYAFIVQVALGACSVQLQLLYFILHLYQVNILADAFHVSPFRVLPQTVLGIAEVGTMAVVGNEEEVIVKRWRKVVLIEVLIGINDWQLTVMPFHERGEEGYAVLQLIDGPPALYARRFHIEHRY